jgi:hypothetical protein
VSPIKKRLRTTDLNNVIRLNDESIVLQWKQKKYFEEWSEAKNLDMIDLIQREKKIRI